MLLVMRFMRVWEAVQVELHGQYSLQRLRELLEYQRTASLARAVLISVAVPLPAIVAVVAFECMPLHSPSVGLINQSVSYWLRTVFTAFIMTIAIILSILEGAPQLSMSNRRLCIISLFIAVVMTPSIFIWDAVIGFPVPFSLQLATTPWLLLTGSILWLCWKDTLRSDASAKRDLQRCLDASNLQVAIVTVYTAYNCLYARFSSNIQTLAPLALTSIKLLFKNRVSTALFPFEDRAPRAIVMTVDVFHVLFVSSTMQQTTTLRSLAATVVLDVMQLLVAYYEVNRVLAIAGRVTPRSLRRGSLREQQLACVQNALHVLDTNPRIRDHPEVALPRHLRPHPTRGLSPHSIVPTDSTTEPLSEKERAQLESAKSILKILHMVESYVLIEYIEVLGTTIYTMYLFAMSHLPNREFNVQLQALSQSQLLSIVWRLGAFAAIELLSLLVFCTAIDHRLQQFSTLRLLSFVLDRHAYSIATVLVLWLNYTTIVPLQHSGQDFTFQFAWLRANTTTSAP